MINERNCRRCLCGVQIAERSCLKDQLELQQGLRSRAEEMWRRDDEEFD